MDVIILVIFLLTCKFFCYYLNIFVVNLGPQVVAVGGRARSPVRLVDD